MPSRGEVWLVDLGMVQKARPALILNRAFKESERALITVIPHTTSLRGSDLEVPIAVAFLKPAAFLVQNPVTVPAVRRNGSWANSLDNSWRCWKPACATGSCRNSARAESPIRQPRVP